MSANSNQVQARAVDVDGQLLNKVLKGAGTFVKEHKKISTGYLVGIILLLFGTGFKVSDELASSYLSTLDKIDFDSQQEVHTKLWRAKEQYDATKGWFGSCDAQCTRYKRNYEAARARWDQLKAEENAITKQAKSQVGIMSEYGVQETRDMFWGTFAGGKDFAKRQSLWDLFFTGLRWGKDEELFSVIVRWLVQLLFNFTLGLIGALAVFVFKLWGLIQAYSPDPFTAVLYFCLAAASAMACVATYLFVLYGAAAGSVAVVAKAIVDHNHRLQQDPNYRRRQHLQGGGGGSMGGGSMGSGGDPRMDPRYRAYQQQQRRSHYD